MVVRLILRLLDNVRMKPHRGVASVTSGVKESVLMRVCVSPSLIFYVGVIAVLMSAHRPNKKGRGGKYVS